MHFNGEKLDQYIIKLLKKEEENQVESHLTECENCADNYLEHLDKNSEMNIVSELNFPSQTRIAALDELHRDKRNLAKQFKFKFNPILWYAVSACMAIFLHVSGFYQDMSSAIYTASMEMSNFNAAVIQTVQEDINININKLSNIFSKGVNYYEEK